MRSCQSSFHAADAAHVVRKALLGLKDQKLPGSSGTWAYMLAFAARSVRPMSSSHECFPMSKKHATTFGDLRMQCVLEEVLRLGARKDVVLFLMNKVGGAHIAGMSCVYDQLKGCKEWVRDAAVGDRVTVKLSDAAVAQEGVVLSITSANTNNPLHVRLVDHPWLYSSYDIATDTSVQVQDG